MPKLQNFANPITIDESGAPVNSVNYSAFASVSDQSKEVPIQNARYVRFEFFTGRDLTGTSKGIASWDSGEQTIGQEFAGMTVDQVVQVVFGL
jgi:hypothetical protein